MLDAQLFGHRRGAFTGAVESFQGVIRAANGGTLFLDEVGEIALELQPKLLRFLESSEVHPVGEPRPIAVDVRVVAATNSRLEKLVADHQFREDLFYRLNVFRVRIPPLRERRDEIPLLTGYFVEKYAGELLRRSVVIAPEALEYLTLRDWHGNVRELSNCIRRAVVLAAHVGVIGVEHVCADSEDAYFSVTSEKPQEIRLSLEQPLAEAFQQIERAMIAHAIQRAGGQMEEAAKLIGLSRKGLYLKRQRHGIVM
jgi:transcriptional regulator with GAF, ATPase, and Fis domain